jgi:predicted transcriptional regulator
MTPAEPSLFDEADDAAEDAAAREGKADADAGRVVPHEEVAEWLAAWGTPAEKPAPKSWFK